MNDELSSGSSFILHRSSFRSSSRTTPRGAPVPRPLSIPVPIVLGGSRIELPPFDVSPPFLLADLQLLVVLVVDAHRCADLVEHVLLGRRHAADGRLVTGH